MHAPPPDTTQQQGSARTPTGEGLYRLLVDSVQDYAVFALGTDGHVLTWNSGAERFKGFCVDEIVRRHFSVFYPPEDIAAGKPPRALQIASTHGRSRHLGARRRRRRARHADQLAVEPPRVPALPGRLGQHATRHHQSRPARVLVATVRHRSRGRRRAHQRRHGAALRRHAVGRHRTRQDAEGREPRHARRELAADRARAVRRGSGVRRPCDGAAIRARAARLGPRGSRRAGAEHRVHEHDPAPGLRSAEHDPGVSGALCPGRRPVRAGADVRERGAGGRGLGVPLLDRRPEPGLGRDHLEPLLRRRVDAAQRGRGRRHAGRAAGRRGDDRLGRWHAHAAGAAVSESR